ncbi:MAG: CheR family methyltransferase [Elusimicrobiota bacterium]|nr:CheR family methyltransferase [Elusimicrobiota bacterium]
MTPLAAPSSPPSFRLPSDKPFFQDGAAAATLTTLLRRSLKDALKPGRPLRAWVPRCASGPDAYSVAIALLEALGSRWREVSLSVFATDSDETALARARAGRYPHAAVKRAGRERLARFFIEEEGRVRVRPFVREACRFVSHRLSDIPPFSRLDLIDARDVLGQTQSASRAGVLRAFHAALAPGGVLLDSTGAAKAAPELFAPAGAPGAYAARLLPAKSRRHPTDEGRLRESEERFHLLFSKADDAILVRDEETGLILRANEAASRLYGWSVAELVGMRGEDLRAPRRSSGRRRENERRSPDRASLSQHRRKDGSVFPADANSSFLLFHGRPCLLDIARDAAPRLRLESRRKGDDARDAFVGELVHELRTPLAVIRGSAESLRGTGRGKHRKAFLGFIENQSLRMAGIVDRLLELNAADDAKRVTKPIRVSLSAVLWDIAAGFVPLARRRGVTIRIDIPANLDVLADPSDVPHIFGNLIDNAIKFSPRRGRVEVSARAEGREAIMSVRDTGDGIAPGDLERVFERFFRADRTKRVKGTGLGLAIVQSIVRANGGHVAAENYPAGGAVFLVSLPLAPEPCS